MQQIYLPKAVCRGIRADVHRPKEALERHRRIRLYERLRAGGCSEALALEAVGTPRSTLFRWRRAFRRLGLAGLSDRSRRPAGARRPQWTRRDEAAVWDMRRRFPFMGRAKIRVMLAREGRVLSEATVGRILAKGVRLGRIRPCAFCRGRAKAKRRRRFDGHARRWRPGMKAKAPGELVQVDHMTLNFPGTQIKEFRALCPRHRPQRQAVPRRDARRPSVPSPIRAGGRRLRVQEGLRGGLPGGGRPPVRPPSQKSQAQRMRRKGQRFVENGVPGTLRRRTDPRRGAAPTRRAPALPQPCQASPVLEHANPHGVPSISAEGRSDSVPYVLNEIIALRIPPPSFKVLVNLLKNPLVKPMPRRAIASKPTKPQPSTLTESPKHLPVGPGKQQVTDTAKPPDPPPTQNREEFLNLPIRKSPSCPRHAEPSTTNCSAFDARCATISAASPTLEACHTFIAALQVIFGSSAVAAILSNSGIWVGVSLTAVPPLLASVDLVFGTSRRATLHVSLGRRFSQLEADMVPHEVDSSTLGSDGLIRFQQRRLSIEADEPPKLRVVDLLSHNDLVRSTYTHGSIYPIGLL